MSTITVEKWVLTITDTMETQRIIGKYFINLYFNNLETIEETGKFLQVYDLPKFNQDDMKNINRSTVRLKCEKDTSSKEKIRSK